MKRFNLSQNRLNSAKYYKEREEQSKNFRLSVFRYTGSGGLSVKPRCKEIYTPKTLYWDTPTHSILCGDIEYGTSNLEKHGDAVFCLHQGLTSIFKIYVDLEELAQNVSSKGYFNGETTVPYLFDSILCRCSTYLNILFTLPNNSILTCLIKDKGNSKRFVNLVGLDLETAIIDDPTLGRTYMDIRKFLKKILIAWSW